MPFLARAFLTLRWGWCQFSSPSPSGILLMFALVGNSLLRYLGIGLEAFQIAAGLLLLKIAVDLVLTQRERETAAAEQEAQLRDHVSVFP